MKRIIVNFMIVITIMFSVLFTGCGSDVSGSSDNSNKEDSNVETMTIAFSGAELSNPWVVALGNGVEDACKDFGFDFVELDSKSDAERQLTGIENVIESGCVGIVTNPIDGEALTDVFTKAREQGIVSVTVAQIAPAATAGIELDDYAYGEVIATNAAKWINEKLGGKGKVAVLAEDNIESSIKRGDAIMDTLKKLCPDIEIVARQQANTPEQGLNVTDTLLIQYPDLNVVVACNDAGGIGAYQAFENSGYAYDENRAIFSGDNTDEAREYIKIENGIYRGTAKLYPYESGYHAVELIKEYLEKGIPKEHQIEPLNMEPLTKEDVINGK